jgi:hypothetical protein
MSERLPHELWYRPEFNQQLESFKSTKDAMSINLDANTIISIFTPDGKPNHSIIKVTNLEGLQREKPFNFEELFALFQVAAKKQLQNPLTHQLELRVLAGIDEIRKSAEILESQVTFSHGEELSRPHP